MYETSAALATALWPLATSAETDWVRELAEDDGLTGFMPPSLPDTAWVLHSMDEHELGPFDMSYVEYQRAFLNSKSAGPEIIPGLDPAEIFADPSDTFAPSKGEHPGPRWRRLRWADLRAGRLADAKALYDHPNEEWWSPSNLWAHDRSWVLCTDYDLWATKLAGPAPLVEALLDDPEIEAVRLPWAH